MTPVEPPRPRRTRQRVAVAEFLRGRENVTSAQDIWAGLRDDGSTIGLATVYRAVQALVDDGEIDALRSPMTARSVYRHCSSGAHHHLVCRGCGLTVEIEGPAVEAWATRTARAHGFAEVEHTLEIFGTCED